MTEDPSKSKKFAQRISIKKPNFSKEQQPSKSSTEPSAETESPDAQSSSSPFKHSSPPARVATKHHSYSDMQLVHVPETSKDITNPWLNLNSGNTLGQIFSTRRPRDFTAGLSSGLKSLTKGVTLGAASLIVAPVYGATQGGVGGFFKGLGAGVIMAVALPVAGVSVGITQAARGMYNTPEAIIESRAGKKWDKKNREWKEHWYSLDEEYNEVLSLEVTMNELKKELDTEKHTKHKSSETTKSRSNKVADTAFYDILQVPTNATQAEIRKAYYKLALESHPDKNPNDTQAHDRFQKLGEAYQVLGEEKRRHDYDLHGKSAAQEMSIIDSDLFFTMLFGSDVFEPYVGKLKLTMFVETFENLDIPGNVTQSIMNFEQKKREVLLALQLREKLEGYVNSSDKQRLQWKKEMRDNARELCSRNFGDAMVEAVGWVYENYSTQFLGKMNTFMGMGGKYAKFQAAHREMGNVWRMAGSIVRASVAARRLAKAQDKKEKLSKETNSTTKNPDQTNEGNPTVRTNSQEQRAHLEDVKQFEETLPLILETMLQICLMDVEATVRKACKKTLKDLATPIETRRQRAEALIELGKIFREEAENYKQLRHEPIDVMRHVEDVFVRAAAEADKRNQ